MKSRFRKKELTRKELNRRNNINRLIVSIVTGIIIFIALIIIRDSILGKENEIKVYQVVKDIPVGTKITEGNASKYLNTKNVIKSLIPEDYITDIKVLKGKYVNRNYKANDIITLDGITDTELEYRKNIKKPVEVSFAAPSLSDSVAGTLKQGDYINIYGMRSVDNDLIKVQENYTFEHMLIFEAFDGNGAKLDSSSSETAVMFKLIIEEEDVALFEEMTSNCTIKIAKILYNESQNYKEFLNNTNEKAANASVVREEVSNSGETTSDNDEATEKIDTGLGAATPVTNEAEGAVGTVGTEPIPIDEISGTETTGNTDEATADKAETESVKPENTETESNKKEDKVDTSKSTKKSKEDKGDKRVVTPEPVE